MCGKAHWQVLSHSLLLVTAHSYFLLIEHEHPYDIIMRNSLNTFNRRESRNFTAFPALPGLYVEQPDIQGRFILKPREAARSQKQSSESITFLRVSFLSSNFYPAKKKKKKSIQCVISSFKRGHCREQKSYYMYICINTHANEHTHSHVLLHLYKFTCNFGLSIWYWISNLYGMLRKTANFVFCYVSPLFTLNAFVVTNLFKISLWSNIIIKAILEEKREL